jgi:hypothetical protein
MFLILCAANKLPIRHTQQHLNNSGVLILLAVNFSQAGQESREMDMDSQEKNIQKTHLFK